MKLNYKKSGKGQPFVILHGLFGSLDNWQTIARKLSENFEVYIVDQRNHGQSPHSEIWNYQVMANDLYEFFQDNRISNAILLGHSMGGKTAMHFALEHCELLNKLIVVDIAPKSYPVHHDKILEGLLAIDLENVSSRKEVEEQLSLYILDPGTKQFLMKNLYWKDLEAKKLAWRFNLDVINRHIEIVGKTTIEGKTCHVPTLFVRGEKSNYILEADMEPAKSIFPNSKLIIIPNAGHWVHAEQPQLFLETIIAFT